MVGAVGGGEGAGDGGGGGGFVGGGPVGVQVFRDVLTRVVQLSTFLLLLFF